jgi:hypothetical protein
VSIHDFLKMRLKKQDKAKKKIKDGQGGQLEDRR